MKITITILLGLTVAVLLALFIGKTILAFRFDKEVKSLFSQSRPTHGSIFRTEQLDSLPEPVRRYFKHVLKDGQPFISYARLTHGGQFRTGPDKPWADIGGEQYFTTETPGFIWKGSTAMFTARDMYIGGAGRLVVSLFSVYRVAAGRGEKFDQGELLRWLGESVWFPTNLLPSERLQWTAIDGMTARLTFRYRGLSLAYLVTFNGAGEICELETKRFMGEGSQETWVIKLAGYKPLNGVVVPTRAEAIWRLQKGDFSYARFDVKTIEYDRPERF